MNKYDVRTAGLEDVYSISPHVRQADADELWASVRLTPHKALFGAFLVSRDTCFTGTADGEPVCMFGVNPPSMLNDRAIPWMIASYKLEFHSREFLRRSRDMVAAMSQAFPFMENYVDARNIAAVRWLQWVGFSVYYPEEHGPDNMPFHRFEMRS